MRFQSKILFSVFCLVLMSFASMLTEDTAIAQNRCCNNNATDPQDGFCSPSPIGASNCVGQTQTFFEDGVNGITLVPMGPPPSFPQTGDLCPNMAPLREECLCLDSFGNTVPCQTLLPPGEGCCVIDVNECTDGQTLAQCPIPPNDLWVQDELCANVPECNVLPPPVTNVPTISQWGLIAMAGLLGIFSLLIIMRRHRYNVS